jgi:hypothetical protein
VTEAGTAAVDRTDSSPARHRIELILYGAITLQALLLGAWVESVVDTPRSMIVLIWLSVLGLMVAHAIADALSHRIASPTPRPPGFYLRRLREQYLILIPGAAATVGVVLAVWNTDLLSRWYLAADVAIVATCVAASYWMGRRHGSTPGRAVTLATVVGLVTGVAAIATYLVKP